MPEVDLSPAELLILESLDDEIQKINNHKVMRAADKLIARRVRLQSARRALLSAGNKLTSGSGTRVTREEIVAFMREHDDDEFEVAELATEMGYSPEVVRGHFNRGKDEVFEKLGNGNWKLYDPEED